MGNPQNIIAFNTFSSTFNVAPLRLVPGYNSSAVHEQFRDFGINQMILGHGHMKRRSALGEGDRFGAVDSKRHLTQNFQKDTRMRTRLRTPSRNKGLRRLEEKRGAQSTGGADRLLSGNPDENIFFRSFSKIADFEGTSPGQS